MKKRRKTRMEQEERGGTKMENEGMLSLEDERRLRMEEGDILRSRNNRKIKTFRVCSISDSSNRHRCSGNTLAELQCNVRKEFGFGEDDVIELRNKSDGTKIGSDNALDLREYTEFLVVINKTRKEDFSDPDNMDTSASKRMKLEPAVVHNVYNIQNTYVIKKPNAVQIGERNKLKESFIFEDIAIDELD
ncbi:hypothetical protein KUTeg_012083 [Tegillarca granosa]|uniref:Uncharacterized protein n=1 Tax=Tegillarca granosa TaxID=220873 RepID=A0ABQ9EYJ5_TEGGR|nr:hypothetical protein KUTeg_012083 [Tegillarca granosa]